MDEAERGFWWYMGADGGRIRAEWDGAGTRNCISGREEQGELEESRTNTGWGDRGGGDKGQKAPIISRTQYLPELE